MATKLFFARRAIVRCAVIAVCFGTRPFAARAESSTSTAASTNTTASTNTAASTSTTADSEAERRALEAEFGAALSPDQPQPAPAEESASGLPRALTSMLPDIALVGDFALAAFSEDENLQGGGHDPTSNGFNLQQLELSLASIVDPYFRFDANIVFSLYGVEVEEAYGKTLKLPFHLQVRAGQFLTRFGRINATHPHAWDFVDQTFAVSRIFGSEGNRGLGAELSWLTPLPWFLELLISSTGAAGEGTARSFYGPDDLGVHSPLDLQWTAAAKQFFELSEELSLVFGLSAATGPSSTGRDNRSDVYGTDIYLKYRPLGNSDNMVLSLQSEWFYRRRQIPEDLLQDFNGYAQVFWRFDRRWGAAGRFELGTPARGLNGEVGLDPLDAEWTKNRYRLSASVTFWPSEFSRLRAQTAVDIPRWREEPIYSAFLAVELAIGAHGAHAF